MRDEFGGQLSVGDHIRNAPAPASREEAMHRLRTKPLVPLTATILALQALQSQRRFCITSQSRCDRSCEAFIARYIGFRVDADEKTRKEVFKQAQALRKSVERGDGEGRRGCGDQGADALPVITPIILHSQTARSAWDSHRAQTEKAMRKLARALPAWGFVESVRGFGDLGFAILIGETGDLASYATKERVWKRLGLAVIDGERQSRKKDAEQAAAHGYNPKRRAEAWTVADSMFRAQWRGAKDDAPAHAIGAYGEVYARRKAHTGTREGWTAAHQDNDARRIMLKALVEDLWRQWNGKPALHRMVDA